MRGWRNQTIRPQESLSSILANHSISDISLNPVIILSLLITYRKYICKQIQFIKFENRCQNHEDLPMGRIRKQLEFFFSVSCKPMQKKVGYGSVEISNNDGSGTLRRNKLIRLIASYLQCCGSDPKDQYVFGPPESGFVFICTDPDLYLDPDQSIKKQKE